MLLEKPILARIAKENKVVAMEKARGKNPNNKNEQFLANLPKTVDPLDTRKTLASRAGVGQRTLDKIEAILKVASEKLRKIVNFFSDSSLHTKSVKRR